MLIVLKYLILKFLNSDIVKKGFSSEMDKKHISDKIGLLCGVLISDSQCFLTIIILVNYFSI